MSESLPEGEISVLGCSSSPVLHKLMNFEDKVSVVEKWVRENFEYNNWADFDFSSYENDIELSDEIEEHEVYVRDVLQGEWRHVVEHVELEKIIRTIEKKVGDPLLPHSLRIDVEEVEEEDVLELTDSNFLLLLSSAERSLRAVEAEITPSFGHNGPPDDESFSTHEIQELKQLLVELKSTSVEGASPSDISFLAESARFLSKFSKKVGRFTAAKTTLFVDGVVSEAGKSLGKAVGPSLLLLMASSSFNNVVEFIMRVLGK